MESTTTASPPTSRAMAAKSSVDPITLILDAAPAVNGAAPRSASASSNFMRVSPFIWTVRRVCGVTNVEFITLERVCAVSAHREHELEDQFVGGQPLAVAGATELA